MLLTMFLIDNSSMAIFVGHDEDDDVGDDDDAVTDAQRKEVLLL